jgi:uncharacterized protein
MSESADATVARVRSGYAFPGPVLELGVLVTDGTCHRDVAVRIPLEMLNRHGLVAGATGSGKTKTLQLMAEQLSAHGVPVFLADVKGDLSGIASPGVVGDKVTARGAEVGQDWSPASFPSEFYALGGLGPGIPIRVTVTSFGPMLLSKVLGLNETQESSLGLVFHYADRAGYALLDLKDLRAVIAHLVSADGRSELEGLGGLSKATAGVILRELIALEDQGAEAFFGEPEFDTSELLRLAADGRGVVSVLELPAVQDRPALFSTFLMWMLADLYEDLPEVGDLDKPKLVFFFDEAHLLFNDASKSFQESVTRTVRLIRSKGVGVFFVTQTPKDVPSDVLAQLGNRVQHALRAFTPDDAKALKATVSTFPSSEYDLSELLTQLGIGEAVVTVLSERGAPTPVAWTRLRAPQSLMGPCDPVTMASAVAASPLQATYGVAIDRESAYERLAARLARPAIDSGSSRQAPPARGRRRKAPGAAPVEGAATRPGAKDTGRAVAPVVKSFAVAAAATLGREIMRGMFGNAKRRPR